MSRGLFVVVEGSDGSGKSTLVRSVARKLAFEPVSFEGEWTVIGSNPEVVVTAEPYRADSFGRSIWQAIAHGVNPPMADVMAFMAARANHVEKVIRPDLEKGSTVLCDRWSWSTMAYQGAGFGVSDQSIAAAHRLVVGDLTPDLWILLDAEPEALHLRATGRADADRFDTAPMEFRRHVTSRFRELATWQQDVYGNVLRLNAMLDAGTLAEQAAVTIRQYQNNRGLAA